MKLNFRTKLVGSLVGFALLTGAQCGTGSPNDPNWNPDPNSAEATLTMSAKCEKAVLPCTVKYVVRGGKGLYPQDTIILANDTKWDLSMNYRKGAKLTIELSLSASSPGSLKSYVSIVDGKVEKQQYLARQITTTLSYETKQ